MNKAKKVMQILESADKLLSELYMDDELKAEMSLEEIRDFHKAINRIENCREEFFARHKFLYCCSCGDLIDTDTEPFECLSSSETMCLECYREMQDRIKYERDMMQWGVM